jgi:prepilin-type N-terminal cleavage/methylation domain-containing protein
MFRTHIRSNRGGFTLVEIMIVVAIIALLAAIAVPNFLRSRKRSQATEILQDCRQIDSAIDQWTIEHSKARGATFTWLDVAPYVKSGTRLRMQLDSGSPVDVLGHPFFSSGTVDQGKTIAVGTASFDVLSDIAPADFWSPFNP